jgi:hypothetical protein
MAPNALCRSGIPFVAHQVFTNVDAERLAGLRSRAEGRAGPTRLFHVVARHAQPRRSPCHLTDDRFANKLSQMKLRDLHCLISLADTTYCAPKSAHSRLERVQDRWAMSSPRGGRARGPGRHRSGCRPARLRPLLSDPSVHPGPRLPLTAKLCIGPRPVEQCAHGRQPHRHSPRAPQPGHPRRPGHDGSRPHHRLAPQRNGREAAADWVEEVANS